MPSKRDINLHLASIKGMSGTFSIKVAVAILSLQKSAGIGGGFLEIGVFEGKFFLPLALALATDERAVAIDTFDWPDAQIEQRFRKNVVAAGLDNIVTVIKRDSNTLSGETLLAAVGKPPRLIHLDSNHTYESLVHEVAISLAAIHPEGVLLVDDMLHPGYPELYDAVRDGIRDSDWEVCAIIDRESIVAATKFVLCRRHRFGFYQSGLRAALPGHLWGMEANFPRSKAIVITKRPQLAEI